MLLGTLESLHSLVDGAADELSLLLYIVLNGLEHFGLGHIHQILDIYRLLVGILNHLVGRGDEFPLDVLFLKNLDVVLYIRGRGNAHRKLHKHRCPTYSIESFLKLELLRDGNHVDGDVLVHESGHRLKNHPVLLGIEAIRSQFPHSLVHTVRFYQQRSKDSLFDIKSLRRFVSHLKP